MAFALKHLFFTFLNFFYGPSFADDRILNFFFSDLIMDYGLPVKQIASGPGCVSYPKPELLNGASFLESLLSYRLLYIGGRLGGGKTSLALALAKWLYETKGKDGRRVVDGVFANFPTDPDYVPRTDHVARSCVILDEGWAHGADARESAFKYSGYGAYARKLDAYWINSSKNKIDNRMCDLRAKRKGDIWMFQSWMYNWTDGEDAKGWFMWKNYRSVFGRYLSGWIPIDDGGILDSQTYEIAKRAGTTRVTVPSSWTKGKGSARKGKIVPMLVRSAEGE